MKVLIWYLLVVLTCGLLTISVLSKNIYLAIAAFVIAMYLERYKDKIPLPKAFEKFRVIHMNEESDDEK